MRFYILKYVGKPIGESGEPYGTKYCFDSACNICGTNAQIQGRLHVRNLKNAKRDFIQTIDGDNLISEKLYSQLLLAGINVGEIFRVIDHNGSELEYYHFHTSLHLPQAFKYNGLLIEDQCPYCKRNGYFNDAIIGNLENKTKTIVKPVVLYYTREKTDILNRTDIISSWEHMGLSSIASEGNLVTRFARPMLIGSERLVALFNKLGIENITYEPVKIE